MVKEVSVESMLDCVIKEIYKHLLIIKRERREIVQATKAEQVIRRNQKLNQRIIKKLVLIYRIELLQRHVHLVREKINQVQRLITLMNIRIR